MGDEFDDFGRAAMNYSDAMREKANKQRGRKRSDGRDTKRVVHMAMYSQGPVSVAGIAEYAGLKKEVVRSQLRSLVALGIVQEAGMKGRAKLYTSDVNYWQGTAGIGEIDLPGPFGGDE